MPPKVSGWVAVLRRHRWSAIGVVLVGLAAFSWRWHASAPLRAARAAVAKQDWSGGIKWAGKYLKDHPEHREARLLLSRSLSAVGRVEEAEHFYTSLPYLSAAELEWRARALVQAGHRGKAAEVYVTLLRVDPDNSTALQHLAAMWTAEGRLAEALELAARLARQPSHAAAGHALQALIHHRRKEWAQSVAHWQRVVELDPTVQTLPRGNSVVTVRFALAEDLLRLGQTAEARDHWEQIVRLEAKDAQQFEMVGSAAERLGDFDAARRNWRRSLELDASQCDLRIRLGQLELELGRVTEALEVLSAAAKECPPSAPLHRALASAYAASGQPERAGEHRAEAERLRPDAERERAISHILIANPESAEAKLILAARSYEAGDYVAAESQVLKVIQQYPDRQDARRMLAQIRNRLSLEEFVRILAEHH